VDFILNFAAVASIIASMAAIWFGVLLYAGRKEASMATAELEHTREQIEYASSAAQHALKKIGGGIEATAHDAFESSFSAAAAKFERSTSQHIDNLEAEIDELRRENARLKDELHKAEGIIATKKKQIERLKHGQ
jgi:F0F1-type ATP synthase membrane subunit b/b'